MKLQGYHISLIICGLHVKQYETKFIGNDPILITCEHSQVNKTLSPLESTVKCTLKGFTIPLGSDQTRCCCSEQRIPVVVVVVVVVCVLCIYKKVGSTQVSLSPSPSALLISAKA